MSVYEHQTIRLALINNLVMNDWQAAKAVEDECQDDFTANPDSPRRLHKLLDARSIRMEAQRKAQRIQRIAEEFGLLETAGAIEVHAVWDVEVAHRSEPVISATTIERAAGLHRKNVHDLSVLDQVPWPIRRPNADVVTRLLASARETGVRLVPHHIRRGVMVVIEPGVIRKMKPIVDQHGCSCIGFQSIGRCRHHELFLDSEHDIRLEVA